MGLIDLAAAEELDVIWSLARRAVQRMNQEGNAQWGTDYPTKSLYAEDLARQELYAVREEGRLLGVACLNTHVAPEYAAVPWEKTGPVLSVHRMVVDPDFQGRGLAGSLLREAERLALASGLEAIHLDTYRQNSRMQALLGRLGYICRGEIQLHGRPLPFPCFEKVAGGSLMLPHSFLPMDGKEPQRV